MARRTTILIDENLFTKLLKVQTDSILKTNSTVSISSIINEAIAEKVNSGNISKKIISLTIENALLEVGKKTRDDIGRRLYEKHQTYFADYLQNPEHLADVLKEEFGKSYRALLDKIDTNLKKHLKDVRPKN